MTILSSILHKHHLTSQQTRHKLILGQWSLPPIGYCYAIFLLPNNQDQVSSESWSVVIITLHLHRTFQGQVSRFKSLGGHQVTITDTLLLPSLALIHNTSMEPSLGLHPLHGVKAVFSAILSLQKSLGGRLWLQGWLSLVNLVWPQLDVLTRGVWGMGREWSHSITRQNTSRDHSKCCLSFTNEGGSFKDV